MSNKVVLQHQPVAAPTPSRKPQDKTAKVAATHFSEQNVPQVASLKTKQFTWKTPFVAFYSLIVSLLSLFIGSNEPSTPPKQAPQSAGPAQVKQRTDSKLETLLHRYSDTIRKMAPATLNPQALETFIDDELSKVKGKSEEVNLSRLEDVALGEKNLTRIRDKLKQMESQQRVNNSCLDLTALLKQHFADETAGKIFEQIRGGFVQKVEEAFSDSEGNPNSKISKAAKELINSVILRDLRSQMEKELIQRFGEAEGKALADSILSDPAIIGETVYNNREIVTPEKRKQIIEKAKLAFEHYPQFKHGLEDIKKYLSQGNKVVRETIVEKHPAFAQALATMPAAKKEEFERLLSETWVKNRLKKLGELQFSSIETSILKSRGFKITSMIQKQVRECMELMLESFLQEEHLLPYEQLALKFEKWALDARLKYIKVPDGEIEKFKESVHLFTAKMNELIDLVIKEGKKFKIGPQFPKAERYLREVIMIYHLGSIEDYFEDLLNRKPVNESKLIESFKEIPVKAKAAKEWFEKYGSLIHSEFAQGEDNPDEALGGGVCAALCTRFLKQSLESPTALTDVIAIRAILPPDRKLQAIHGGLIHFREAGAFKFPPETLAQMQLEETQKLILDTVGKNSDQEVKKRLTKILQETKGTNACFYIGWAAHATALRFDSQNNKYLFFDPNYGTLEFKRAPRETLDQLASRMATAYVELYQWAYPDRERIMVQQFSQLPRSRI